MSTNTKIRKVDVVGVTVKHALDDSDKFSFAEILNKIDKVKSSVKIKSISCELMSSEDPNLLIGLVKTSQTKEVPPILDMSNGKMRKVDTKADEGLGFANVFLFDKKLNVFLYEINKDGCYLTDFKTHVNNCLKKLDLKSVNLDFPIIIKSDDLKSSVQKMNRVTKFLTKINTPNDLKKEIEESGLSTKEVINNLIDNPSGASVLKKEYFATNKKINPVGLKSSFISSALDWFNEFRKKGYYGHFETFIIEGFTEDVEGKNVKKTIDCFENTYREHFKIDRKEIHLNLQETERKDGIISVYDKIKDSLYRDYLN